MSDLRPYFATTCTALTALAFVFGAQARFTSRLTPDLHVEQRQKTAESRQDFGKFLGIGPRQVTQLIGVGDLVIAAGMLYKPTKKIAVAATALWLSIGAMGRFKTRRSILPPLVVILIALGSLS